MIKDFIRRRIREQMIDGQNMSPATQTMCNKMSVKSYDEALSYVMQAVKTMDDETRRKVMVKIHVPLENLKHEQTQIDQEVATSHMSGDSMVDEANTYWHQIQSTICELGSDFQ